MKPIRNRPSKQNGHRQGIQSVEIGYRLLEVLGDSPGAKSLRDLAHDARMSPSKAHRYLVSLIKCGLVIQDQATSRYDIGESAIRLGLAALNRRTAVRLSTEAAIELNQRLDKTVLVSIWGERGPTVIGWYDASQIVICNINIGSIFPLLRTATGRVFLAYLPRSITASIIDRELADAPAASVGWRIRNASDVDRLIQEVRRQRLGITREEFLPGLSAIAAPVFDHQGRIVAALAILGGRGSIEDLHPGSTADHLRAAANDISQRLGFQDGSDGTLVEWSEKREVVPPALRGGGAKGR